MSSRPLSGNSTSGSRALHRGGGGASDRGGGRGGPGSGMMSPSGTRQRETRDQSREFGLAKQQPSSTYDSDYWNTGLNEKGPLGGGGGSGVSGGVDIPITPMTGPGGPIGTTNIITATYDQDYWNTGHANAAGPDMEGPRHAGGVGSSVGPSSVAGPYEIPPYQMKSQIPISSTKEPPASPHEGQMRGGGPKEVNHKCFIMTVLLLCCHCCARKTHPRNV